MYIPFAASDQAATWDERPLGLLPLGLISCHAVACAAGSGGNQNSEEPVWDKKLACLRHSLKTSLLYYSILSNHCVVVPAQCQSQKSRHPVRFPECLAHGLFKSNTQRESLMTAPCSCCILEPAWWLKNQNSSEWPRIARPKPVCPEPPRFPKQSRRGRTSQLQRRTKQRHGQYVRWAGFRWR